MYGKNQKINFYIESINFDDGDEDLADYIEINLRNYLKDNSKTKIKVDAKIDYQKNDNSVIPLQFQEHSSSHFQGSARFLSLVSGAPFETSVIGKN